MNLKKLANPVIISNPDLFGRNAKISFFPVNQKGWHWQCDPNEPPVSISADLLSFKRRRLVLAHEKYELNIFEHIGVLRWAGLDGIKICSTKWPPYDGRSWESYQLLHRAFKETDEPVKWCTLDHTVMCSFPGVESRFTKVIPDCEGALKLHIISEYEGIGMKEILIRFPASSSTLEKILKAFAPGWPSKLFYLEWLASKFGWPHLRKSLWPNCGKAKEEIIEQFAYHRALDLLGALSLIHPTRMLSGTVISYCSGHWADVQLIKQSQDHIIPLS